MRQVRSMPFATRALVSLLVLLQCLVVGCSSNRSRPLPKFDSIAVISVAKPADGVQARTDSDSRKAVTGTGAKGGAAAGAATSLLCGPFVVLCLPFFAATGAIAGAAAGGVAGVLADTLETWPREQAERAKVILSGIDARRDFFVEIRDGVIRSVPEERMVAEESAEALIRVGPTNIELVQDERTHLSLRMTAVLIAESNRDKRAPRTDKREYIYETAERPVEEWLDEEGAVFDAAFTECIQMLVSSMAWDLRQSTH